MKPLQKLYGIVFIPLPMKIKLLQENIPVHQIYWQLLKNEWLWNKNTRRTENPSSPHRELDDIWVRFGEDSEGEATRPHDAKWYEAVEAIPLLKQVSLDILRLAEGTRLGGILLTRIPPGAACHPHEDNGWHANYYEKYALQITSAPGQKFCFNDEELETKPGDLYWFENQSTHWVTNPTKYERVTLIVCVRKD